MSPTDMILKNFDYLCKANNLKKGEVEKSVGVSAGYFSKNPQGLNINVVYNLSQVLKISIDDLCSKDFYEKMLLTELEKEKTEIEKRISELKARWLCWH